MDIKDLKIIVTGAASGMGKTFALELVKGGAKVMACDLSEEGLLALKAECSDYSDSFAICTADVSKEDAVINLVEKTVETFGTVNGLINNAGIFRDGLLVKLDKKSGDVRKMSLSKWQAVLDVDLTGPFLCTREVAAHMIKSGTKPGVIINISSVSRHGNMGQSNYSAAKAGLVADTAIWGKELARYGIRTGAIAPGFIDTPILSGMRPEMLQKLINPVPLRRVGTPYEIYQGIKFIIECDYFNGRCLDIDGGLVL